MRNILGMTDAALAKLARRFKAQDAVAKKEKEAADTLKKKIVDEFARRGTKALEHSGVKMTIVTPQSVEYDAQGLLRRLTPEQRRLVTVRNLDVEALSRAVQEGHIRMTLVDKYSDVKTKASYPVITL